MKVLLHSLVAAPSLVRRYLHAQTVLRTRWIEPEVRTGVPLAELDLGEFGCVVSHDVAPPAVRAQLPGRVFGGRRLTRPESLTLLADRGIPTMEWTLVASRQEGLALFDSWNVERMILKRSFTSSGNGFHVLTRNQPRYVNWDMTRDILCKEVNQDDGQVFKVDLFGGRILASYVLKKQPLRERLLANDDTPDGYRRLIVYREANERPDERHRGLVELPGAERSELRRLSRELTQAGFGCVSVDLMRKPDGSFVAVELNTERVVTWWTEQFEFTRERFAAAVVELVGTL